MKNKQGITIAALIVAIIGLSIGFAAFTNTLSISSSASVNPSDANFIVQFSKVANDDQTGSSYQIVPDSETYGDRATINSSNKKLLEGVHAKFTAPNQTVTYTLYVRNTGAYVAYLKELAFANATNATQGETYKHCYAATTDSNNQLIPAAQQATPSLVSAACEGIDISVTIGTASNITPSSASKSLGNQALAANGGYVQATITISYANNASYVDGPMEVEFGTISFTASSNPAVAGQQEQGGNEQQGGQDEPQQTVVDDLIPTEIELNGINEEGSYPMVGDYVSYSEMQGTKFVSVRIPHGGGSTIIWLCDADSAATFSQFLGSTVEPNKWYYSQNGMPSTPYTGSSPISFSDFDPEDIKSESYLTRVINSFSNNS